MKDKVFCRFAVAPVSVISKQNLPAGTGLASSRSLANCWKVSSARVRRDRLMVQSFSFATCSGCASSHARLAQVVEQAARLGHVVQHQHGAVEAVAGQMDWRDRILD